MGLLGRRMLLLWTDCASSGRSLAFIQSESRSRSHDAVIRVFDEAGDGAYPAAVACKR